jgi:predicted dehydrogenase
MKVDRVRVALIGCGRISGHHCRSIRQQDGVELTAVCDLIGEKAESYGREYGVRYFTNYHEMLLEMPEINTVAVVTPSGMHHEHTVDIMRRYRKHMIVEKPTFLRGSQVRDAFMLADELGLQLIPVFQNRHNRAVRRVRKAIQDGELGAVRIAAVRVRWCRPQRYYDMAPWRGTFAQDGGALTNQGVHHVDLLAHLVGDVRRVNATMRTLGAKIEVEDAVVATAEFESGALGVLEVSTCARPIDYEASLSLVCEHGLAQIGGIAVNELQVFTPEPDACTVWSEDFSGNIYGHGHEVVYRDIARTLLEGVPYPVDRGDCFRTVQLLNAFYRADEAGRWVGVADGDDSARLGRPNDALADLYRTPLPASRA